MAIITLKKFQQDAVNSAAAFAMKVEAILAPACVLFVFTRPKNFERQHQNAMLPA